MKKKYTISVVFVFAAVSVIYLTMPSAELKESRRQYSQAKEFYKNEEYDNALDCLSLVIESDKNYDGALLLTSEIKDIVVSNAIKEADKKAIQYDYDGALEIMNGLKDEYKQTNTFKTAINTYQETKDSLVPYKEPVAHVFFHSLIVDTSKAFDGDNMADGYNKWMTTIYEFNNIMQSMYDNGYVLVDIHNIANETIDANGKSHFTANSIYLPEGKKPFVLSIDDVNYYEYMKTDGFAKRLVLDEFGNVKNEYLDNGEIKVGNYDVIPLLDEFVTSHPDFSYHGAKGIIAVTGYEGILGYRLNNNDHKNPNYDQEVSEVGAVISRLKETGWIFASHSWGHLDMATCSNYWFTEDDVRWKEQVGKYVGETDVYIYPFGAEIDYSSDRLTRYQKMGYKYFCGVWSTSFVGVKDSYVRQSRINLDGYMMLNRSNALKKYFDIDEVVDPERPALLP